MKILYTDFQQTINKYIFTRWWEARNNCPHNKLHHIPSTIKEQQLGYGKQRKEVILARLRIGHIFIAHSYILKGEDHSVCIPYQKLRPIKHLLIECKAFEIISSRVLQVNNLEKLFSTLQIEDILNFLKENWKSKNRKIPTPILQTKKRLHKPGIHQQA